MIKAKEKPLEEILEIISGYDRILNTGCGGCVSICLAGGQREVNTLNARLLSVLKDDGIAKRIDSYTMERQCNDRFLAELDGMAGNYDCILSMACGAGVQHLARRFEKIPVFPLVNTVFIGVDKDFGMYEEKCRACGQCVLGYTGGICPVSRCSKGLFNGPCGGTDDGSCEISPEVSCAWLDIYERLADQDRLDDILKVQPPMEWQNQIPRTIIQAPYENRYRR